MKLMKLRIENGVLCGDIPDSEWGGQEDWERFETLIVPEGVTEIKAGAFAGHPWLRKVIIPGTVRVIGAEAFRACRCLSEVEIGEGVKRIGDEAFAFCCVCKSLRLPQQSLTSIGDRAFYALRNAILDVPASLTHLGKGAFSHTAIEKARIPGTLRAIPAHAFQDCAMLETVVLQEGVEAIDDEAFAGCQALVELSLPATLKKIGQGAFECAVEVMDDGRVYPPFLLPSRDVVIEDEWFKYVAETYDRYK